MDIFESVVSCIIRPSRDRYKLSKLGPNHFTLLSRIDGRMLTIDRQDHILPNKLSQKIHLSVFQVSKKSRQPSTPVPTIIYLHSNNGSRQQGLNYSKFILEHQINVVVFDCAGSGMSDGEYITLGVKQSEDLTCVVDYLEKRNKIHEFSLWGRSMGAVTALLFASRYNGDRLKACIYDSPFASLKKLIKEIASNRTGLPKFVFKPVMTMVDSFLKNKVNFSIEDLNVKGKVHLIRAPGLFITSQKDSLIGNHHTEKLYKLYTAEKQVEYINAEHQQKRGQSVLTKCLTFLRRRFTKPPTQKDSQHPKPKPQPILIPNPKRQKLHTQSSNSNNHSNSNTSPNLLPISSIITLSTEISEPPPPTPSLLTCKSSKKISLSEFRAVRKNSGRMEEMHVEERKQCYKSHVFEKRRMVAVGVEGGSSGGTERRQKCVAGGGGNPEYFSKIAMYMDQTAKGMRRVHILRE